MIAWSLAWDKVRGRRTTAAATAASLLVAVALLVLLANAKATIERRVREPSALSDLIVGPKGGSLDLFLSAGLHAAPPRGRVPAGVFEEIVADYRVARAAPIVLADPYRGWPVVGTSGSHPAFVLHDDFSDLLDGDEPLVLAGAAVGSALALEPGTRITLGHGADTGPQLEVAFVLSPISSSVDRTLFVPLAALRHAHAFDTASDHHRGPPADTASVIPSGDPELSRGPVEAHAILVTLVTPLDLLPVLREWNDHRELTAIDPREEAARLTDALGRLDGYLWAAGGAILVLALLALVATFITQAEERRREAAILRALGASFPVILLLEISHAVIVAGAGSIGGVFAGGILAYALELKDRLLPVDAAIPAVALLLAVVVAAAACIPLYRIPLDDALRPDR